VPSSRTTSSTPASRLGRPRDSAIDRAIVEASRALVLERGISGYSLHEVARRAGVPKSTVYRRWGSKQHLLLSTLDHLRVTETLVPDTGTLRGDLVTLVRERFEAIVNGDSALIRIGVEAASDPELSAAIAEILARRRRDVYPVLERAVARGELSEDTDFDDALDLVLGAVWGRIMTSRPIDADAAEIVVDRALRGLARREPT
jgi:AcrR family transcriptional regulator